MSDERPWWDLEIRTPLVGLLGVEAQAGAVQSFAQRALDDLVESGLLTSLESALSGRG